MFSVCFGLEINKFEMNLFHLKAFQYTHAHSPRLGFDDSFCLVSTREREKSDANTFTVSILTFSHSFVFDFRLFTFLFVAALWHCVSFGSVRNRIGSDRF